jgi:hypothetical protein
VGVNIFLEEQMKKILGLGVMLGTVLLFAACSNKVSQEDLQKNYWDIKMEEDDGTKMTLNTHFTDDQIIMKPKVEETKSTATNEWEEMGEEFAKQYFEAMTFKADYTLKDDTIHVKSDDLDLDETYTVKKDGNNIVFEAKKDDSETMILKPAKKRPAKEEATEQTDSSLLAEDVDSSEVSSTETADSSTSPANSQPGNAANEQSAQDRYWEAVNNGASPEAARAYADGRTDSYEETSSEETQSSEDAEPTTFTEFINKYGMTPVSYKMQVEGMSEEEALRSTPREMKTSGELQTGYTTYGIND